MSKISCMILNHCLLQVFLSLHVQRKNVQVSQTYAAFCIRPNYPIHFLCMQVLWASSFHLICLLLAQWFSICLPPQTLKLALLMSLTTGHLHPYTLCLPLFCGSCLLPNILMPLMVISLRSPSCLNTIFFFFKTLSEKTVIVPSLVQSVI